MPTELGMTRLQTSNYRSNSATSKNHCKYIVLYCMRRKLCHQLMNLIARSTVFRHRAFQALNPYQTLLLSKFKTTFSETPAGVNQVQGGWHQSASAAGATSPSVTDFIRLGFLSFRPFFVSQVRSNPRQSYLLVEIMSS